MSLKEERGNKMDGIIKFISNLFGMFFMPVGVKNDSTEDYQSQCSSAKEDIKSNFVHLGSSSSTRYAMVNAPIQNISPPINTPTLNPWAEINCPRTKAAKVSLPTSYNAFDKLVRFTINILLQIKKFVKYFRMKKIACPLFRSAIICVCLLLSAFHSLLSTRYLLLSPLYAEEVDIKTKLKELKHKDPAVRMQAVEHLGQAKAKEAILPISDALRKEKNKEVKLIMIDGLGNISDEKAAPVLKEHLNSEDREIKGSAACALAKLGQAEAIPVLEEIILNQEEKQGMRSYAVRSLTGIKTKESVAVLGKALTDEDKVIRLQTVVSLANIGGEEVISLLREALKDKEADVRLTTVNALAYLGNEEAYTTIKLALRDSEPEIVKRVEEILKKAGKE